MATLTAQKRNDNSTKLAETISIPQKSRPVMQWISVDKQLVCKWVTVQY